MLYQLMLKENIDIIILGISGKALISRPDIKISIGNAASDYSFILDFEYLTYDFYRKLK